ncbi:MAG: aminoglycoside phosphotransferase family protein [Armatimonas sp.]
MNYPEPFATNIRTVFDDGAKWLERLPALQEEIAAEWGLTVEPPPWPLSYNWVAPAAMADGTPAVLKLGVPNSERTAEIETLRLWNGKGCARLLRADADRGAMLIEKIAPGTMLCEINDDDEQTRIASGVFQAVRYAAPLESAFPTIADWAKELDELRPQFDGGFGLFPPELVEAAQGLYRELLTSQDAPVLLHGDLHHFNILLDKERGWLAIDPQGVIGEAEYECGALLRNYELSKRDRAEMKRITARRIDILAEILGYDKNRIIGWGLAQAVLSAWWDWHEGLGSDWTSSMFVLADVLKELQT